ncbi:MAG: protein translocase subunit SecD, partial [Candidatus Thioglobus sp.]|nr:protein translocase subunit SecD [Candidatus Thioglobus sp.]
MNQFSALKNTLIAFFLLLSALYALPNVFGSDLAVQISAAGDAAIAQSDLDKVKETLESNKVRYKSVELVGRRVLARFEDNKSQLGAKEVLKQEMGRNYV